MLPPDFEERKRAVFLKSERMRVLNGLRAHGLDPETFPHRFLTQEEQAVFLAAVDPLHRWNCPIMEKVPGWGAVTDRIKAWAANQPEITIWYEAAPGNGGLVVPGNLVFEHLDTLVSAVKQRGNAMFATPDGRMGCVYSEQEYENLFGFWGEP